MCSLIRIKKCGGGGLKFSPKPKPQTQTTVFLSFFLSLYYLHISHTETSRISHKQKNTRKKIAIKLKLINTLNELFVWVKSMSHVPCTILIGILLVSTVYFYAENNSNYESRIALARMLGSEFTTFGLSWLKALFFPPYLPR